MTPSISGDLLFFSILRVFLTVCSNDSCVDRSFPPGGSLQVRKECLTVANKIKIIQLQITVLMTILIKVQLILLILSQCLKEISLHNDYK